MSLLYFSCSSDCAPSEPLPIALASYRTYVPEGSAWYNTYPFSSLPPTRRATPNGRLCTRPSNLHSIHDYHVAIEPLHTMYATLAIDLAAKNTILLALQCFEQRGATLLCLAIGGDRSWVWGPARGCVRTMLSSPSSPNRSAKSHSDCVQDSTGISSLYVKRCICIYESSFQAAVSLADVQHKPADVRNRIACPGHCMSTHRYLGSLEHTCVSTRACSMRVLESAESPLLAQAMCESISAILSILRGSCVAQMTA